jgi:hypothetical protein
MTAPPQVDDDFGFANLAFVGCQPHILTIRLAWDRSFSWPSTVLSTWLSGLLSRTMPCRWRLSFMGRQCV